MWTKVTRGRIAEIERKTKRYPTDLTDEEWAMVEPVMPKPARTGRQLEVDLREFVNAVRYLARLSERRSNRSPVGAARKPKWRARQDSNPRPQD